MIIYNSALKTNNTYQFQGLPPTERFEQDGCVGLRRNIITEGYYEELETCDIIYAEPPFPSGIKVFDERAKEKTQSYSKFAECFSTLWEKLNKKPRLAITNKRLEKFLSEPDFKTKVKLNTNWETLSCWGIEIPDKLTNLQACQYIGRSFSRIGDITCGYGIPVMAFKKSKTGNTFVASDYDPHCITVLRTIMNENLS
tara:strand:+ start:377 stop:970 length:594 start_codon:yes stop_codon:yes gene_type:complete